MAIRIIVLRSHSPEPLVRVGFWFVRKSGMSRYERRPELDAPAHLHPVDNVNADPIGEGQQVRIDGDVRKHAVWTSSSWQEVGRCEAISEEHDRERPIV